jgi:phage-related protein
MAKLTYPTVYEDPNKGTTRFPNPSLPITMSRRPNIVNSVFSSGHEQRRPKGIPLAVYDVRYNGLFATQASILEEFFMACYGSAYSFYWSHPDPNENGEQISVRFDGEFVKRYKYHSSNGAIYEVQFKLNQVTS